MPQRLKKPCAQPGCPKLIDGGTTYCEKHRGVVKKKRDRYYDREKRDQRSRKFYNSTRWRKLRDMKIREQPLCEMCKKNGKLTPATEVDHIIPIKEDWSKRLDINNLQSLCHSCHMKKTASE